MPRGPAALRHRVSMHGRRSSTIVREWIAAEAGAGRLLPWVPVAFGVGIAFYFTADHEPVASVTAVAAMALVRRGVLACGGKRYFRSR